MKFITNNLFIKLLSIVVAFVFWLVLVSLQSRTGVFPGNIPITYTNTPENLAVITDTRAIQVKITAEPNVWSKLSSDSFKASVNLSGFKEGTYNVNPEITTSVGGVQIVDKIPTNFFIRLEPIATKTIPVSVKIKGEPQDNKSVLSYDISQKNVSISGPTSVITKINEAYSDVVFDGKSNLVDSVVSDVYILDELGEKNNSIVINPKQLTITLTYGKSGNTKTVGVRLKTTGVITSGVVLDSITVIPGTVTIQGDPDKLTTLSYIETTPFSLSQVTSSDTYEAKLDLPNSITLLEPGTTTVKVVIVTHAVDISKELQIPIEFTGLPNNHKITNQSSQYATVIIKGSQAAIAKVNDGQVKVVFNVSSLSKGEYTFSLSNAIISKPDGLSAAVSTPDRVQITISES